MGRQPRLLQTSETSQVAVDLSPKKVTDIVNYRSQMVMIPVTHHNLPTFKPSDEHGDAYHCR